jgi:predicted trehalose synthase
MEKPTSTSWTVHDLRTGKIHTVQASASEIRRSVGVRPSEAKVAAKALRVAEKASKPAKVPASKPARVTPDSSHTSSRAVKNR